MKKTRILSLILAVAMIFGLVNAGAESLNLAELPLTTEEGATVSILAINSYSPRGRLGPSKWPGLQRILTSGQPRCDSWACQPRPASSE